MTIISASLSIVLGVVFLVSAIPKLRHPEGFVLIALEYRLLPPFLGHLYGRIIPPLEFLVALLMLSGTAVGLVAIVVSLLLFSFIVAIAINMVRGRDLDCNCFGPNKRRKVGWILLFQDGVLLGFALSLTMLIPVWTGLEPWSVASLLGLRSTESAVAFLVEVGLAMFIWVLLRRSHTWRKKDNQYATTNRLMQQ